MKKLVTLILMTLSAGNAFAKDSTWLTCNGQTKVDSTLTCEESLIAAEVLKNQSAYTGKNIESRSFAAGNGDTGSAQIQRDGTPSKKIALKQATTYAMDQAFVNILDSSSSVAVLFSGDNGEQFIFKATTRTPRLPDCTVEILVSKETGMAFQDKIEACQNLN